MKVIQKFKSRSIARLSEANGVRFGQRGRRFCNSLPRLGWSFLGPRSNKRRIHHFGCTKSPLELSLSERKQATWQGKAKADETPLESWAASRIRSAGMKRTLSARKAELFSRDCADSSRADYVGANFAAGATGTVKAANREVEIIELSFG